MPSDINKLMQFWQTGDEDLAHELFHPNLVVRAMLTEVHSPSGYAKFVRSFVESFSGLKPQLEEFFTTPEGDKQTILWSGTGTHTGLFRGVPPTGEQIMLGEYHIQYLEGDLITRTWTGPWRSLDLWELLARHKKDNVIA